MSAARPRNEAALLLLFSLRDELGDLRVCAYRLDKYYLIGGEIHSIRRMEFFAALHEDVVRLLSFRIVLTHDVVDVREYRMGSSISLQLTEIHGPVGEKYCLVRSVEFHSRFSIVAHDVEYGSRCNQQASQNPDNLHDPNSALIFGHRLPFA
jgi:hypothetical protein